jgi:predicted DNA repair protein MutK
MEEYGLPGLGHAIHSAAETVGHAVPAMSGLTEWAVSAAASGIFGLLVGAALIPLVQYVAAPMLKKLRGSGKMGAKR